MVWHNASKIKPLAFKTGCWDGKKSDEILVCTQNGLYRVAVMYHVIMDGFESFDFYDDSDFEINNVQYWTEIDCPF